MRQIYSKKMLALLCLSKNGVFRVKNRYYILIKIESHQKYFLPENTQKLSASDVYCKWESLNINKPTTSLRINSTEQNIQNIE